MATPKTSATRQTLEDSWRLRLEEVQGRYRKASEHYRMLLQIQPEGTAHDPNGALALAREAESEALAEYALVLQAFTELIVMGKIPEGSSPAESDSR